MKSIIDSIISHKYITTIIIFIIWITFIDDNNLIDQYKESNKLDKLKQDQIYYQNEIDRLNIELEELSTDNKSLEKIAREKYYMHKPNEDVYIIDAEKNGIMSSLYTIFK